MERVGSRDVILLLVSFDHERIEFRIDSSNVMMSRHFYAVHKGASRQTTIERSGGSRDARESMKAISHFSGSALTQDFGNLRLMSMQL